MDSPDNDVLHVWTAEQVRKFVEYLRIPAGNRGSAVVAYVVTVGCGLRRGETLELRWSDVDLEAGRIWIRQPWSSPPASRASRRRRRPRAAETSPWTPPSYGTA